MNNKDIKAEARKKLALNLHQAIVLYAVEYLVFITLIAFIILASVGLISVSLIAGIVMIIYGVVLLLIGVMVVCTVGYGMVDFYLAEYKCKPYNVRRIGDTLARGGVPKILVLNLKRTLLGFLLLLCLIVPGVIYLIRSSMAQHLLVANPKMNAKTALSASNKVMSGKTGAYFSLMASLTGWWLLGIVTLGVGFIFIIPYAGLCKTVYYKRNLQGDKTVYNTVVQPLSPSISSPEPVSQGFAPQQNNAFVATPIVDDESNNINNIEIEPSVPPIETLGDADIAEMNAAMRDLNGEAVETEVPEVAIPTVNPKTHTPPPQPEAPAATQEGEHNMEDSDLVEIVNTIDNKEPSGDEAIRKKFNKMFAGGQKEAPKRDYFANMEHQNPNDFVTADFGGQDDPVGGADSFVDSFDAPVAEPAAEPVVEPVVEHVVSGDPLHHAAARPSAAPHGAPPAGESRLDRLRRERDERLKKQ